MEIAVGVPPATVEPAAASTDELICEPCEPEEAKEGAAEEAEEFFEEPTICGLWGCVLSRTHSGLCEVPPLAKRGCRKPQVYDADVVVAVVVAFNQHLWFECFSLSRIFKHRWGAPNEHSYP